MKYLLLILFIFGPVESGLAQEKSNDTQICFQPFAYKFDEFRLINIEDTKRHLKAFEEKLNEESSEARGYIYVYGGKKVKVGEVVETIANLKNLLNITGNFFDSKFWVSDGGFKSSPTAELYIRPFDCSNLPSASFDFNVEQIEFVEAPLDKTLKKTQHEIADSLIKKIEPVCPPAARATRNCNNSVELFVVIDEKGNIIFSKALSGHPLLRATAETTVKNWKVSPTVYKGKKYSVVGRVLIEFTEGSPPTIG